MAEETKTDEPEAEDSVEHEDRDEDESKEDDGSKDDGSSDDDESRPSEERLEKLEEGIEQARRESEEGVHGSFYEGDQPMYVQSGDEAREDPSDTGEESKSDDQNISP
jgi:hypothetical protein